MQKVRSHCILQLIQLLRYHGNINNEQEDRGLQFVLQDVFHGCVLLLHFHRQIPLADEIDILFVGESIRRSTKVTHPAILIEHAIGIQNSAAFAGLDLVINYQGVASL